MRYKPEDIANLKTLCTGQCCSLKVETSNKRVWLCRVAGGVTVETYNPKTLRWESTSGSCYSPQASL